MRKYKLFIGYGCWESFPVYGKPKISPLKAA